jgi:hypothetical protein
MLITSKVMAKANTPSVNASSRLLGMKPADRSFESDKPRPRSAAAIRGVDHPRSELRVWSMPAPGYCNAKLPGRV